MAAEGSDVLAVVYAVHDFDAENPDELSFKAGERILVTEKDDQYQDGWWQVGELDAFTLIRSPISPGFAGPQHERRTRALSPNVYPADTAVARSCWDAQTCSEWVRKCLASVQQRCDRRRAALKPSSFSAAGTRKCQLNGAARHAGYNRRDTEPPRWHVQGE